MLSVYHIEKLFRAGHFEPLLRGVCPIGMELSLPLRVRISQHPAAVTALALRRVLELTYGRTDLSHDMLHALLAMQSDDGSFENDPLSTAAAAEVLQRVLDEHARVPSRATKDTAGKTSGGEVDGTTEEIARITNAIDRAWQALETMQAADGLYHFTDDRSDHDRALTAAFIVLLTSQSSMCRHRVGLHAIANWFADHDESLNRETQDVWRLAMVEQANEPPRERKSKQVAAIAA